MTLPEAIAVWERNPVDFVAWKCPDGALFGLLPPVGSVVCAVDHESGARMMAWQKECAMPFLFCGFRMGKTPQYFFEVIADPLEEQWSMAAYERCV